VEACKHKHVIADETKDQAVRESAKHCTAPVAMNDWKGERVLRDTGDESLRGLKKLVAQASALTLVPLVRLVKFRGSGRPKKDTTQRDLMRLRTSSHGMPPGLPAARSRSNSSDRTSISRRWGSVSGNTSGFRPRRSHS